MYNNWSHFFRHLNILPYSSTYKACTKNVGNSILEPWQTCKALRFSFLDITTVGNLFYIKNFKDQIVGFKNQMKDTYRQRSRIGLQPLELHVIIDYLLSESGKIESKIESYFQLWIKILLPMNLFLQFDKCCDIKLHNFEQEIFTIEVVKVEIWHYGLKINTTGQTKYLLYTKI